MKNKRPSKRNLILDSASQIVLERGAANLTLDAVATHADVSKGGLLYHFPSKDALITGMIDHCMETFAEEVEQVYATLPDQRGRWLSAYVIVSFKPDDNSHDFLSAIIAAYVNQPELLQPFKMQMDTWQEEATTDGTPTEVAHIVMAATTGLWLEQTIWTEASKINAKDMLLRLIDTLN